MLDEKADYHVIVPAALLHDIIEYPKNDARSQMATNESADKAEELLKNIDYFPKDKIEYVKNAILSTASNGTQTETLEEMIVADADLLEITGSIILMRLFASTGIMKRPFYHEKDPLCKNRKPEDMKYAVDYLYNRSLKVKDLVHTKSAKKIAEKRQGVIEYFLQELEQELLEL